MTREELEKSIKCCNPYDENCGDCPFHDLPLGRCFEKLASSAFNMLLEDRERLQKQVKEYQDKIEQGTLIELPCKVGDKFYQVIKGLPIQEWEVETIGFSNVYFPKTYVMTARRTRDLAFWKFWCEDFGETVFLTREEAEKRLKELQE